MGLDRAWGDMLEHERACGVEHHHASGMNPDGDLDRWIDGVVSASNLFTEHQTHGTRSCSGKVDHAIAAQNGAVKGKLASLVTCGDL